LKNVIDISSTAKIKTIAILVDESSIQSNTELKEAIVREGILSTDIAFLTYKDLIKKNEVFEKTTFSLKDIDCNGDFINSEANLFLNQKFDLLISYYDVEKNILMMLTQKINADFKVGFSTIDKRLNHFMINTDIQNQRIFVSELFKYLRILNKI
jgi:hypothetical protein